MLYNIKYLPLLLVQANGDTYLCVWTVHLRVDVCMDSVFACYVRAVEHMDDMFACCVWMVFT